MTKKRFFLFSRKNQTNMVFKKKKKSTQKSEKYFRKPKNLTNIFEKNMNIF